MARDRLLELQQRAGNAPTITPAPVPAAPAAPAAPAPPAAPASSSDPEAGQPVVVVSRPSRLARFLRRAPAAAAAGTAAAAAGQQEQPLVQQLQQELAELSAALAETRAAVDEVSRQQCRQLNSPRHQEQAWQQTQDSAAAALANISRIKTKLDRLQKKLTESLPELTTTQAKMLQNQVNGFRTQLLTVVQRFNEEEMNFRAKKKDHLKRQLQITGADMDDDELENLIDRGDAQIFNESILMRVETARAELNEAEERYEQIRALEMSIQQLHEMFLQLSLLVQQQGEMVDRIEENTFQTAAKAEKGAEQLHGALKKQQRGRKMRIVCGILVAVIIVILVIILLSYLG
ncbi:syntaxin-4-like [Amphibalanus amphitrite]|uniref:syntaxin-4-like n=1 Tax=Amphibalanus amphitrite TaxID=1232801 RepID=UPI001C916424|nr:syntaxin-4-like [Amphibalanus amphitrite]XP_043247470.1 syntaxin-4-like [Amphibalanus amphitrite]XP_043247471.1 syntaxin-4-like [Amphibalanus amphitrite]XP_043247472.1 syntaxin-4-like [Amphibalanus amphitrite]